MSCTFCRIVSGDIPASKLHEGERLVAFKDLNPQAPMHVLIVPREHIATLNDLEPSHDGLAGEMVRLAAALATTQGYDASGYRTVFNCNADAGQTVFHIHLHVLAGRKLAWPPG
jgi:histidine triad (HIT) family protein